MMKGFAVRQPLLSGGWLHVQRAQRDLGVKLGDHWAVVRQRVSMHALYSYNSENLAFPWEPDILPGLARPMS